MIVYDKWGIQVHHGDCLTVLRDFPDDSVDSIVTDPPASISFMSKTWDSDRGGRTQWVAWLAERMTEALCVLKPGGHALVWALPRTSHWTALALEDAGFEIRDCIVHIFGGGMPKSLNVSKAIDKAADYALQASIRRAAVVAVEAAGLTLPGNSRWDWTVGEHAPGAAWWRTFQKWLPGLSDEDRDKVEREIVRNVHKTAGWFTKSDIYNDTKPATDAAKVWDGWGTGLKPSSEHWWLARKPFRGPVAANVLRYGTGALNIDACRVPAGQDYQDKCRSVVGLNSNLTKDTYGAWLATREDSWHPGGRWPPNTVFSHSALLDPVTGEVVGDACGEGCVEGCPVVELDRQSGATVSRSGGVTTKALGVMNDDSWTPRNLPRTGYDDSGGVSRFFPTFRWEAKAPSSERPRVAGKAHATIKPVSLMRWMTELVTPPGGVVLDLFAGSGTTGQAARAAGFRAILVDEDPEAMGWIVARLEGHRPTETVAEREAVVTERDLFSLNDPPPSG